MAIAYTKPDITLPLDQRYVRITGIVSGEKIDLEAILGRPARSVQIIPHNTADSIGVRYNTHRNLKKYNEEGVPRVTYVSTWLVNADVITYTSGTLHTSPADLDVRSMHITSLTFGSGGTSISLIAW